MSPAAAAPAAPPLVATRAFLNQAIAAGLATVLTEPGVKAYAAACVEKGLDAGPQLQQLSRCLVFADGQRDPQRVYVALHTDALDEIEKGALADLFCGYGEAAKSLLVTKTGAEIKAQVLLLGLEQRGEAAALQAAMTALQAVIGLAPPPELAGPSSLGTKGSDGLGELQVPCYPWRETTWDGPDAAGNPPVRDAFSPSDAAAPAARAATSAQDAQNRRLYNEYAWQLRDNMRDQVMAARLAAALPPAESYRLPLPLVLALRFGPPAGTPAGTPAAPAAGATGAAVEG